MEKAFSQIAGLQGLVGSELSVLLRSEVKVTQSCPTLCDPMDYTVHGILLARIVEWGAFPFSRGSSQPRSPALQADSLPAEPQGKSKNTTDASHPGLFCSPGDIQ